MNSLKVCFAALSALLIVAGCAKADKILPKKEGLWNISSITYSNYSNNTLDTSYTDSEVGTLQFEEGSEGIATNSNGDESPFTWTYTEGPERIAMCYQLSSGIWCIAYEVTKATNNHLELASSVVVDSTTYDEEWVLDRIK
jgi:hypothetical protein